MGEILTFSQSSLLLSRPSPIPTSRQAHLINFRQASHFLSTRQNLPRFSTTRTHVVPDSKPPTTVTADSGGSDDNFGGGDFSGGGGSGGNNDEDGSHGGKRGMSMSQKLTLGYAVLVGVGGLMGYLKGGSKKSLVAGGVSALVLYCVYTMIPTNPVLGSAVGFGISAALLGVMGSRFKKSGKVFPAGVVAFVSLVMSGGYLHGILRSMH